MPMGSPVGCPHCGHPAAGPFCPGCGRHLAALRWVAEPPASATRAETPRPRRRYAGPPGYRFIPQWGFTPGPWRAPALPAVGPVPLVAARSIVGVLAPLLWATAAVALLAAGAEAWRYLLLLDSRTDALPADEVAASDALVAAAGWVAPLLAVMAGLALVQWTVRASQAAADQAGVVPSRSPRALVLGWVVPGLNLTVPGSAFAEIEHTALGRVPGRRPRPTRLLLVWWGLWLAGLLFAAFVLAWSLRSGVQARADGVVLHAVLDVLAAVTAGMTAVVVVRLTRLLGPPRIRPRELVLSISTPTATPTPTPAGRT
jgi:hypothetical protein